VNGYGTPAAHKELVFSLKRTGNPAVAKPTLPANGAATVIFDPFDLSPGLSRGEIRLTPRRRFSLRRRTLLHDPSPRAAQAPVLLSGGADRALLYFPPKALSSGDDPAFAIDASHGIVKLARASADTRR